MPEVGLANYAVTPPSVVSRAGMEVREFGGLEDMDQHRAAWEDMAGECIFRSWTWLGTWQQHYLGGDPAASRRRRGSSPSILTVFQRDDGSRVNFTAALPAYVEYSPVRGRVLRLLGDGEVCSDHLGIVASTDADVHRIAAALATHLAASDGWDAIDFAGVDHDDSAMRQLGAALEERGCAVLREEADRCWAIELPASWDDFLAQQSKSHRKQLRQLERRVLIAGVARWELVESEGAFAAAWSIFADLHQRRRASLGEPGCFASPTWASFHQDVARRLLAEGRLRLSVLWVDGEPIAADYHMAGGMTTCAYQGGVHPERMAKQPGQLAMICAIRHAIAEGRRRFDFLRGDEPYKAHWRATPRQAVRLMAAAPRPLARRRWQMWLNARRGRQALRRAVGRA